ncbi:hypothetical protein GS466_24670 [Rhodococcus hoagii]|nr:hypothetical protein [Prescottella equi]MBM4558186.1 hypothetical protein [Prescottella equi]
MPASCSTPLSLQCRSRTGPAVASKAGRKWRESLTALPPRTAETSSSRSGTEPQKILDIFEGTQQIQQLIIARRLLGKSSAELK